MSDEDQTLGLMHTAVSELSRQMLGDMKDLRTQIREDVTGLRNDMRENHGELREEISSVRDKLDTKVGVEDFKSLTCRVDEALRKIPTTDEHRRFRNAVVEHESCPHRLASRTVGALEPKKRAPESRDAQGWVGKLFSCGHFWWAVMFVVMVLVFAVAMAVALDRDIRTIAPIPTTTATPQADPYYGHPREP